MSIANFPNDPGLSAGGGSGAAGVTRQTVAYSVLGLKDQVWNLYAATAGGLVNPNTQQLYGTLIGLLTGDVVNKIFFQVGAAASGTPPTGLFLVLYNKTGTLLAQSANLAGNAAFASVGLQSGNLSSPFTVTSTDAYYLGLLENGAYGTTNPSFVSSSQTGGSVSIAGPPNPSVKMAAQATPPASAVFVLDASNIWFGWG
jgi:hypothetical protein